MAMLRQAFDECRSDFYMAFAVQIRHDYLPSDVSPMDSRSFMKQSTTKINDRIGVAVLYRSKGGDGSSAERKTDLHDNLE